MRRIVSSSSQAQITPLLLNSTVSLTFVVLLNQEDLQLISRLYIKLNDEVVQGGGALLFTEAIKRLQTKIW